MPYTSGSQFLRCKHSNVVVADAVGIIITLFKKPPYGKFAEKGPLFGEFWA